MYASGVMLRRLFCAIGAVAAAQPCPEASRSFTGRLATRHINPKYPFILVEATKGVHRLYLPEYKL